VELIANQMTWSANTIGKLDKGRWEVEMFFRDIKQPLYIKSVIGTSENAVMIELWAAMITILMLNALNAMAKHKGHLSN